LYEDLRDLTSKSVHPSWFGAWLDVERSAKKLRTYQPALVPGLFQDEDYALGLLTGGRPTHTEEQIRARVTARMERQEILNGSLRILAVIDEAALMRPIGSPEVMVKQLERLERLASHPLITLQIMELKIGAHPGVEGGFVIADLSAGTTVVYRDSIVEGEFTDSPDFVATVIELWETIQADALPQRASIGLVRSWAERWKNS
jgi:hypothetical protein